MGHVEPDGAATGSPTRLSEHAVWPLWRRYKALFRTWTILISVFTTPGAWGWLGNDVVSGLRRNPSTHKAFSLLADVSQAQFNALSALATLNQRRQELGFQMLVVFYVTVPVTLFVSAGEIDPAALKAFVAGQGDTLWMLAAASIGATLIYLAALWRSRQMVQVLDLIRIERAVSPLSTVELRDQG
jgi:hypothetical protein